MGPAFEMAREWIPPGDHHQRTGVILGECPNGSDHRGDHIPSAAARRAPQTEHGDAFEEPPQVVPEDDHPDQHGHREEALQDARGQIELQLGCNQVDAAEHRGAEQC